MVRAALCAILLLALSSALLSQATRHLTQEVSEVKICIPSAESDEFVAQCTAAMAAANTNQLNFTCMAGGSVLGCTAKTAARFTDLVLLGATDQWMAYQDDGLIPLVSEIYSDISAGASYYAIAAVNKAMCDANPNLSLADFAGKRSCHTGYRRTSGWTVPVGFMTQTGVMPIVNSREDVAADAESVASFFAETCAVGTQEDSPANGGSAWDQLCTACATGCNDVDIYSDYPGTLRGVMEDACDVAFTKHTIPLEYASDGTAPEAWGSMSKDELRLVCPSGGCATVEDYERCTLGRVPARALVATLETVMRPDRGAPIQAALTAAAQDPEFLEKASQYVFSDGAVGLQAQTKSFDDLFTDEIRSALEGKDFLEALVPGVEVPVREGNNTVRICIPTLVDQDFIEDCTKAIAAANTAAVSFVCVEGGSNEACSAMIEAGTAHLVRLGATDQWTAYQERSMMPLVTEMYADVSAWASYYAIAAVSKAMCDANPNLSLGDLRGKRSCHTGYRRTAGWAVPVGFLTQTGVIPIVDGRSDIAVDAQSVQAFFSQTCAVGTSEDGPAAGGEPWGELCTACGGTCVAGDIYSDHPGTLRGVMEDACDVAFTKHTIPLEYASDGIAPDTWSAVAKADLRLVCPSGGCATVEDYERCTLGRIPALALVGTSEMHTSETGAAIQTALTDAAANNPDFLETASQFVFSSGTQGLQAQTKSFNQLFANEIGNALEGKAALEAQVMAPTSTGGSSGVSAGAAAGIGIGCGIGCALIAALATIFYYKRKARYVPHLDEGARVMRNNEVDSGKSYA